MNTNTKENRIELYKQIEKIRETKIIAYVTSSRIGMETQIAPDILPKILEHLDAIGDTKKISLFLCTNGGIITTAWSLVNLIRSFCKEFEVIVPLNCFSSGTLICLGADNIIMTKQALLGPVDPSINGPFNPANGNGTKLPLSVEHVNAYIEMAKKDVGIKSQEGLSNVLIELSNAVSPIALGNAYKTRAQIQMLAHKLLNLRNKKINTTYEKNIIKFLCSESGSHDYSICRKEAREFLKLPIETPSMELYSLIKQIFRNISNDMEMESPFDPQILSLSNDNFSCKRALIESSCYGSDIYVTEGSFIKTINSPIKINRTKEGWIHEQ